MRVIAAALFVAFWATVRLTIPGGAVIATDDHEAAVVLMGKI